MTVIRRQPKKARAGIKPADLKLRKALKALADAKELAELGRLLRQFNIFRVLRFEHGEIRHSNMLAWLFQPRETHGLGDLFLRNWLLRVVEKSGGEMPPELLPSKIRAWKIQKVVVEREWNHVDLLLHLTIEEHGSRVVAIENKLRARQSEGQLSRYWQKVRAAFPGVPALFVFLTEREEEPAEAQYCSANHAQVHAVLKGCLKEVGAALDPEVAVLLKHYLGILEKRNMGNQDVEQLVEAIYREHRLALEAIFERRTSPLQRLFEALRREMEAAAPKAGLTPRMCNGNIVRFLPKEWKTPANLAGQAWSAEDSAFVLCELTVGSRDPRFDVTVAGAKEDEASPRFKRWKTDLWRLCEGESPGADRRATNSEARWLKVYSVRFPGRLKTEAEEDPEKLAADIWRWCAKEMRRADFQQVIKTVAKHLKQLPKG
jgi:hypothetical protein